MKRRVPIISTLVVALAAAVMVALAFWQLGRLKQKEAALAVYRANMSLPVTAFPGHDPVQADYLFRTVTANCLRVTGWQVVGGRSRTDQPGWRHIASCTTGAEGPGFLVDLGVSMTPDVGIVWGGGPVTGRVTWEPDSHSFITRMAGEAPPLRLMIVSDRSLAALSPTRLPDPSSVPNNHKSYALQWFGFAGMAVLIYGLALRKRWREEAEREQPS